MQKTPSSLDRETALVLPSAPKPAGRNKKNKKKVYDVYVKIDLVSETFELEPNIMSPISIKCVIEMRISHQFLAIAYKLCISFM